MQNWMLALASVLLGLATWTKLSQKVQELANPIVAKCFSPSFSSMASDELPPFLRLGVPGLDNLMCLLTFFGISFAIPSVWIPVWILSTWPRQSVASHTNIPLNPALVIFIAITSAIVIIPAVVMVEDPLHIPFFNAMCWLFNIAPIVLPLAWIPFRAGLAIVLGKPVRSPEAIRAGCRTASTIYTTIGLFFLGFHIYSVVRFALDLGVLDTRLHLANLNGLDTLLQALLAGLAMDRTGFGPMLVIDGAGMWCFLVFWSCWEDGLMSAAWFVIDSVVLGPTSAFLSYAAKREDNIAKTASTVRIKYQ
eukprot:jgi/Hompol1/2340/HPOL_005950-RA